MEKSKATHHGTYAWPAGHSCSSRLREERGDQGLKGSKGDNGMDPPGSEGEIRLKDKKETIK